MPTSSSRKPSKGKYGFGKVKTTHELELPSHEDPDDPSSPHNVCLVKRPGVQGLMKAGVLDSFDSLTSLVQTEHIDRADGKAEFKREQAARAGQDYDQTALLKDDPKKIIEALALIDRVVLFCVVEPKLTAAPESEEDRDPEVLYVDEIDLDDRMFILNYVMGGSKDLETFRKGSGGGLAGVAAS